MTNVKKTDFLIGILIIHNSFCFMTSLREDVVLFKFHSLRPRVLIVHAHDQIAVEDIKLFTTVPSDGPTQSPYDREEEQTLQPHGYLLAGHLCTICS